MTEFTHSHGDYTIHLIPILSDNYCYAIVTPDNKAIIIDPGKGDVIAHYLKQRKITPLYILNTHHHSDHVKGNKTLKRLYPNVHITCPFKEQGYIAGYDSTVNDNDKLEYLGIDFRALHTPGHTAGHITYYSQTLQSTFVGDTLFVMGCGRLFEGTAKQLFKSLQKIAALPDETDIYCGHEYSVANAQFCHKQMPNNPAIKQRLEQLQELRNQNKPTIPSTLAQEKETNLFLMAQTAEELAQLRIAKDKA